MKNKKTAKIFTLVLSCILLIGAIMGITAVADEIEETPGVEEDIPLTPLAPATTVSIDYKNVSYAGEMKLVYYAKAHGELAEGQSVKVLYWEEEGAEPTVLESQALLTIGGEKYNTFFSAGFGPVDMRKTVYAQAAIVNADGTVAITGDVLEYSLFEYALALFSKNPTADQLAMLTQLLDYGASVQQVMFDEGLYPELPEVGYADEYYIYEYEIYVKTEIEVPVEDDGVTAVTDTEGEGEAEEETPVLTTTKEIWAPSGQTVRISLRAGQMKSYEFDKFITTEDGKLIFEGFGSVDENGDATFEDRFTVTNAAGIKINTNFANRDVTLSPKTVGITRDVVLYRPTTATLATYDTNEGFALNAVVGPENAKKSTGTFYYYNDKLVVFGYKNDAGKIGIYVDADGNMYSGGVSSVDKTKYTFIPIDDPRIEEVQLEYVSSGYTNVVASPTDAANKVGQLVKSFKNERGDIVVRTYGESEYASQGKLINFGAGANAHTGAEFKHLNTSEQPDVVSKHIWETDMYIDGNTSHNIPVQIFLENGGNAFWGLNMSLINNQFGLYSYKENAWKSGYEVFTADGTKLGTGTGAADQIVGGNRGNGMDWRTWYNIRVEYEIREDGSRAASVYLNGVLSGYSTISADNFAKLGLDDSVFTQTRVYFLNAARDYEFYFDNTYVETIGTNAKEEEIPDDGEGEEEETEVLSGTKYYYLPGKTETAIEATFTPDENDNTKGALVLLNKLGETPVTTNYTYQIDENGAYAFFKDDVATEEIALAIDEAGVISLKIGEADPVVIGDAKVFGDDPTYVGTTGNGQYAAMGDTMDGAKPSVGTVESSIVEETIGEAVNKVLQLNMHAGKSEGGSAVYTKNTSSAETFVVDVDFKFIETQLNPLDVGNQWVFKFALQNSAGTEIAMPAVYPVGDYWEMKVGSTLVKFDADGHTKLSNGEWYNIRIEYTYVEGEAKDSLKVFINGFEGYSGSPNKKAVEMAKIAFNIRSGGGFTTSGEGIYDTKVMLDNVYVGAAIKDNAGNGAYADDALTNKTEQSIADKTETVSATRTSADVYVYESDLKMPANGSFIIKLLASQTEGTASVAELYATAKDGAVTIATTEGGKPVATFLSGKWFGLRVEYTPEVEVTPATEEGAADTYEYFGKYVVYMNGEKIATVNSAAEETVANTAFAGVSVTAVGAVAVNNVYCNAVYQDVVGSGDNFKNSDKYITGEGEAAVDGTLVVDSSKVFAPAATLGQEFFFETDFKWLGESGSIVLKDNAGAELLTVNVVVNGERATVKVGDTEIASVPVGYWRNISISYAAGVFTVNAAGGTATVEKKADSFAGATLTGNAEVDNTYVASVSSDYSGKGVNASTSVNYTKNDIFTAEGTYGYDEEKDATDTTTAWITAKKNELVFGKTYGSLALNFINKGEGTTYIFETNLNWLGSEFGADGKVAADVDNAVYFTISLKSEAGDIFTVYALGEYEIDPANDDKYLGLSTSKSADDIFAYVRADLVYNVSITYTVTEATTAGKFAGEWNVYLNGESVATGTTEGDVDNTTFKTGSIALSDEIWDTELELTKTYVGAKTIETEE